MNPDYVNYRITTVFLDGSCVDDLKTTIIKDGSVLALSSAMPGLAGATMRRGSTYASLRESITYSEKGDSTLGSEGTVTVKLFNVLINELGPVFLQRGIT